MGNYALEGKTDDEGAAVISPKHMVDSNNSTMDLLQADAIFTGDPTYIDGYVSILVTLYSDEDSAVDGLSLQFSPTGPDDGGYDWHGTDAYTYIGESGPKTYTFQPVLPYYRIVYTNGSAAQGSFHITSQLHAVTPKSSSHRLEDNLSGQDDATLQKAVVSGRAPDGTYANVNADATGSLNIAFGDTANLDAFSRQRVSNPDTVFDSTFIYDLQPLIFGVDVAAGGSVTHVSNEAAAELAVDGTAGADALIQTYQYVPYIPGKSTVLYQTFVMKVAAAGVVKQCGLFDDDDGIFLEQDGTSGLNLVRRTSVSGSAADNKVAQASWNLDTFDGQGVSGLTLDVTKGQILAMDLQWLGMGRVRVGFDIDGRFWPAHQFLNANNLATVYMRKATLPIRWKIDGDSAATFDAVCASVQSEGGSDKHFSYEFSDASASRTAPNGAREPIVALRMGTTFNSLANRMSMFLLNHASLQASNGTVFWELLYLPDATDVTGGAWGAVSAYSGVESNLTATAITGTPIVVDSWWTFSTNQNKGAFPAQLSSARYPLALSLDGSVAKGAWVLSATGVGGAETVFGSLTWDEIR